MRALNPSSLVTGRPNSPIDRSIQQVLCGSTLCRLQVWSEAEWAALAEDERPSHFVHAPGLGWVGAVPDRAMN